jgi:predicted site-specific integrase-resolvase
MSISTDKLLTRKQVAGLFCVSRKTIARWTKLGELTAIYINSRVVRYDPAQVNQLIREATV